jgi:hypothetical protein
VTGWLRDLAENTGRTVTGQIGAQAILYALGVPPLTGLAAGVLVFGWSWLNGMAWRRWGRYASIRSKLSPPSIDQTSTSS